MCARKSIREKLRTRMITANIERIRIYENMSFSGHLVEAASRNECSEKHAEHADGIWRLEI